MEKGPQVGEEILAVVEVIPLERIFERTEEQIDNLTVQHVELDKVILQELSHFRAKRGAEFLLARTASRERDS